MKKPLFNQLDRQIIRERPGSSLAQIYNFEIAKARFAREFAKAAHIKEFVDWLFDIINKFSPAKN